MLDLMAKIIDKFDQNDVYNYNSHGCDDLGSMMPDKLVLSTSDKMNLK